MFAVIGVLVVGGHLVERGELTAGSLLSFLLYTVNLAATVGGIAGLFAQLMQAVGSSQKVFIAMSCYFFIFSFFIAIFCYLHTFCEN